MKRERIVLCKYVIFLQSRNCATSNKWRIKRKMKEMSLIFTKIYGDQRISSKA